MAEVRFVKNELRPMTPKLAAAYEAAIREAIGLHRGRFSVWIRRLRKDKTGVSIEVKQQAWGMRIGGPVTPKGATKKIGAELRDKLREKWSKGSKQGRRLRRGGAVRKDYPHVIRNLTKDPDPMTRRAAADFLAFLGQAVRGIRHVLEAALLDEKSPLVTGAIRKGIRRTRGLED